MAVTAAQIEALDNEAMNARCAALINRYWARQGVVIELSGDQEVTGEDVLPDLRCRVADFFAMPGE